MNVAWPGQQSELQGRQQNRMSIRVEGRIILTKQTKYSHVSVSNTASILLLHSSGTRTASHIARIDSCAPCFYRFHSRNWIKRAEPLRDLSVQVMSVSRQCLLSNG